MEDEYKREKIIFIREEIKKFRAAKKTCKNTYKNWFRTVPSTGTLCGYTAPNGLWKSPKFNELDNNYYFSNYGRFYITCLHILYNRIRCDTPSPHITKVDEKVYKDDIDIINVWIEERIKFQRVK